MASSTGRASAWTRIKWESGAHRLFGVPPKYARASITDFGPEIVKSVMEAHSALISGPVGTGKTHLLAAICRAMVDRTTSVLMISMPELVDGIKQGFGKIGQTPFLDKVLVKEVLLLDDLGTELKTDWLESVLFRLIDHRYKNELRTFVTTNIPLRNLPQRLDSRIVSRLMEQYSLITLEGRDLRHGR